MMLMMILFFMTLCYMISKMSLHLLTLLLFVELMVIMAMVTLLLNFLSWFICLMFIMMAVCMGAYGISIMLSSIRSKGDPYLMSL